MSSCYQCPDKAPIVPQQQRGRSSSRHLHISFFLEVQRHGAQLLDVADDLTLSSRCEAVTELRRDFVELSVQ